MIIPPYLQEQIVDEKGYPTEAFASFLRNLLQNMQISLSDEGYWIPSASSASSSVTPPQTGGQLGIIQASYISPTSPIGPGQTVTAGVQIGTLVFDPAEVNGGTMDAPLGQFKGLMNDGTFHKITNT